MALPTASDNAFPSILITEGTEPSAPAAGKQRLYIDSTTHLLKATNSSGTDRTIEGVAAGAITSSGLTMATARLLGRTTASTGAVEEITVGSGLSLSAGSLTATGGSGVVGGVLNRLTSGDVTITATTNVFASNVTGLGDITLACATGDYIEAGLSAIAPNTTANSMKFDVCTVVSAAAVNFFSNGTGTGSTNGVSGWYCTLSVISKAMGSILYVAQAGDISGGNIVLRLTCFVSGSRVLGATANQPLTFWARNLSH